MSGPRKQPPPPSKTLLDVDVGDDALHEIEKRLDPQSASHLAQASKEAHKIFQPQLSIVKDYVQPLLHHIANGELTQADQLLQQLKQQDEYLLQQVLNYQGKVTDPSGRTFTGITVLQYALWAYDRFAWETLKPYMNSQDMLNQLKELETTGVEYRYQGQRYQHQHHYDFQPLLDIYKEYINYVTPRQVSWSEAQRLWVEKVGKKQKEVPWHVAAEYCSSQPFVDQNNYLPAFNQRPQFPEQAQGAQVYDWRSNQWRNFYSVALGVSSAICKGKRVQQKLAKAEWVVLPLRRYAQLDQEAIDALCKRRKLNLKALRIDLEVDVVAQRRSR